MFFFVFACLSGAVLSSLNSFRSVCVCVSYREVWKRFLDDGSSKLDLKKKGDEFVNAVDGWFQSQESQVDTALQVACFGGNGNPEEGKSVEG